MKTITCPTCKHPHQLYYYVEWNGNRELCYTCNKVEKPCFDKEGRQQIKTFIERVKLPMQEGLDIPEEWSGNRKKQKKAEQQYQLPLMR